MDLDLVHIWKNMGGPSKAVAATLMLMGILVLTVFTERMIYLLRSRLSSKEYAQGAAPLLRKGSLSELAALAAKFGPSHLAKMVQHGAQRYMEFHETEETNNLGTVEACRREMARRQETIGAELRRGMSALATVGSVAPFVGLLGTVLGILAAFSKIGATGSGGLGAVSAGIAEALIETAFGLAIAIPAVLLFNYLNGVIEGMERELATASGEFLDEVERIHRPKSDKIDKSDIAHKTPAYDAAAE